MTSTELVRLAGVVVVARLDMDIDDSHDPVFTKQFYADPEAGGHSLVARRGAPRSESEPKLETQRNWKVVNTNVMTDVHSSVTSARR